MYSSDESGIACTRAAPLRYGLNPRMYQVRHWGHCAQWRMRSLMGTNTETAALHSKLLEGLRLDICGRGSARLDGLGRGSQNAIRRSRDKFRAPSENVQLIRPQRI